MLSHPTQYLPQGWGPQFPVFQGIGSPPIGAGPFGQPIPFGGNTPFGYDPTQVVAGQQYPFGMPTNPFVQNPFVQNPYAQQLLTQNPYAAFATHPYTQTQLLANPFVQSPFANSFGHVAAFHPGQQVVPALGQLAQQIAVQSAVTQQIGAALHQLAQQLAVQSPQAQQSFGLGGGQPFAGINPQAQAWGANRPTIQ